MEITIELKSGRALGDGTRLRILRHLAAGTATVGRIDEELSLAKPTVYEHRMSVQGARSHSAERAST
jgi:DNA-binding transcriptional ArsR family regulator